MVALSGTLGTLLGWHIYLITHNMTTIEVGFQILADLPYYSQCENYRGRFPYFISWTKLMDDKFNF